MTASDPLPRDRWIEELLRHLYRTEELEDHDDPAVASQAQSAHHILRTMPPSLAPRRVRRRAR